MILWKFKERPETRIGMPNVAFRWTFQIEKYFIGFIHEHQSKDMVWKQSHTAVFGITVTKLFRFGTDHVYYDGPHCQLCLGYIYILWGGNPFTNWCDKCSGEK